MIVTDNFIRLKRNNKKPKDDTKINGQIVYLPVKEIQDCDSQLNGHDNKENKGIYFYNMHGQKSLYYCKKCQIGKIVNIKV